MQIDFTTMVLLFWCQLNGFPGKRPLNVAAAAAAVAVAAAAAAVFKHCKAETLDTCVGVIERLLYATEMLEVNDRLILV